MVEYSGEMYRYVHNLQGDVVGILDDDGNLVVEYKYDAWGKPITVAPEPSKQNTLGELNPFRFRSYVWDNDIELYYLNNRYFFSTIQRFISVDSHNTLLSEFQSVAQYNLYGYCWNNPICIADSDGLFPFFILSGVIGAIAGGIIGYATTGSLEGALIGAAAGGIIGATGGAVVSYITAGSISASTGATIVGIQLKIAGFSTTGYATFEAFKKVHGSAGKGRAWHHIIEQTPSNIQKFGAELIHNSRNIVSLPHGAGQLHNMISAHYSSVQSFTNGMTVRKWLSLQSFEFQLNYGLETLSKYAKELDIAIKYAK